MSDFNLSRTCEALGLTKRAFSKMIGVNEATAQRWDDAGEIPQAAGMVVKSELEKMQAIQSLRNAASLAKGAIMARGGCSINKVINGYQVVITVASDEL